MKKKISFLYLLIICFFNCLNAKAQMVYADFYIESVEEVKTEIKTYEDDNVIINAELPKNIEIKAEPLEEKDQRIFYDVWFEENNEVINYNALIHVEFKNSNFKDGKIVKMENDKEINVTDLENKEKLQSIWFSAGGN